MTFRKRRTDKHRFWSKVALPDENGCMLWTAAKSGSGYGVFWFAGRQTSATRVSLILTEGEPADPAMEAAHECRNTDCVAPAHLRWATHVDNEADKLRDKTLVRGNRISHSKLTAEQVLAIRARQAAGESRTSLAREYGVTRRAVMFIINRATWAWLDEEAS